MHQSLVSSETTLLYFFSCNFIWFRQKEPIKIQNFRLSTVHMKFYQICTLRDSFCWKYVKFQLKSIEDLCCMTRKIDRKFEEKLNSCFKNDKTLAYFDLSTWNSRNFHFDWFLLCKVCNLWPKKVQRSYLNDTEEWCKICLKKLT